MTFPIANKATVMVVMADAVRQLTVKRRNHVSSYDAYLSIPDEGGEPL